MNISTKTSTMQKIFQVKFFHELEKYEIPNQSLRMTSKSFNFKASFPNSSIKKTNSIARFLFQTFTFKTVFRALNNNLTTLVIYFKRA